jgi:sigma-B regulation protein RsbU (phosphoserine phosphatase)
MSMVPMTWPAFPDKADIDMFGCVTPAKAVGGDLYDFRIREGKLFFCIGDVSGKGIPAALVMTVVSSMFRMLSDTEENPAKIVSSINYSLSARNESLMFITLFVGALDLSTGELQYVNAGHNAPILIFGGKPRMLQVDSNLPVGIMQDWEFSLQKTTLAPGTVLFLYTDGLTEATRSGGQLFGEARVLETLAGQDEKNSAEDIITHMTDAVSDFVGDSEQSDDLTMLVMKILHSTLSPSA